MFDKIINFIESEWYRPVIAFFAIALGLMFTIFFGSRLDDIVEREEKRLLLQEQSWKQQGYKIGE